MTSSDGHPVARHWPALLLLGVIVIIYGRVAGFPYVHDDWTMIYQSSQRSWSELLAHHFNPVDKLFYRPLIRVYMAFMHQAFGLNTVPIHVVAMLIHFASSLLVVALARHVTNRRSTAWFCGFVYAASIGVHADSLIWAVGTAILAATFLTLLALWLFLKDWRFCSVVAFLLALLFRDDAAVFPLVLAMAAVLGVAGGSPHGAWKRLRPLWPYGLVLGCYVLLRLVGTSPFALRDSHPYHPAFSFHILERFWLYAGWMLQDVLSLHSVWVWAHLTPVTALVLVVSVTVAVFLWRSDPRPSSGQRRHLVFLVAWLLIGLLPAVVLPNQKVRYYLCYSLVPAIVLFAVWLTALTDRLFRSPRVTAAVLGVVCTIEVLAAGTHFAVDVGRGLNQYYTAGMNSLARRCAEVELVHQALQRHVPQLPAEAVLVFDGVDLTALHRGAAPRVWYNDRTIRVYAFEELRRAAGGFYVKAHDGSSAPRDLYLEPEKTFVFRREGETLSPVYLPAAD